MLKEGADAGDANEDGFLLPAVPLLAGDSVDPYYRFPMLPVMVKRLGDMKIRISKRSAEDSVAAPPGAAPPGAAPPATPTTVDTGSSSSSYQSPACASGAIMSGGSTGAAVMSGSPSPGAVEGGDHSAELKKVSGRKRKGRKSAAKKLSLTTVEEEDEEEGEGGEDLIHTPKRFKLSDAIEAAIKKREPVAETELVATQKFLETQRVCSLIFNCAVQPYLTPTGRLKFVKKLGRSGTGRMNKSTWGR